MADGTMLLLKRALLHFSVLNLQPEGFEVDVEGVLSVHGCCTALSLSSEILGVGEWIIFEVMCDLVQFVFIGDCKNGVKAGGAIQENGLDYTLV